MKSANKILKEMEKKDRIKVMFYLKEDIHAAFKNICKARSIRMSDLIDRLIQNFVNEVNEIEEIEEKKWDKYRLTIF